MVKMRERLKAVQKKSLGHSEKRSPGLGNSSSNQDREKGGAFLSQNQQHEVTR